MFQEMNFFLLNMKKQATHRFAAAVRNDGSNMAV
jgi:hypothetical protein